MKRRAVRPAAAIRANRAPGRPQHFVITKHPGLRREIPAPRLSADRNVRLDSYTRWQDGGWARFEDGGTAQNAPAATLDLSRGALAARSVVILSDVQPGALTVGQWQGIASYVDHGGGLVLLGGPNSLGSALAANPLSKTVPVPTPALYRDGRFPVRVDRGGRAASRVRPSVRGGGQFPRSANRQSCIGRRAELASPHGSNRRRPGAAADRGETPGRRPGSRHSQ